MENQQLLSSKWGLPSALARPTVPAVSEPGEQERRTAARYPCELPVALRLLHDPTLCLRSRSRDIGSGGIFLYSDMPLPLGEEVVVTFKLPRQGYESRLLGIGKVVRVEAGSDNSGLAITIEQCAMF